MRIKSLNQFSTTSLSSSSSTSDDDSSSSSVLSAELGVRRFRLQQQLRQRQQPSDSMRVEGGSRVQSRRDINNSVEVKWK